MWPATLQVLSSACGEVTGDRCHLSPAQEYCRCLQETLQKYHDFSSHPDRTLNRVITVLESVQAPIHISTVILSLI